MANRDVLSRDELIEKVMAKKEFSRLPRRDVELVCSFVEKSFRESGMGLVKRTRELLHRMYTMFVPTKMLSKVDRDAEWFLKKHISTRERLPYYDVVYKECLRGFSKKEDLHVIDFGCGVNGFSYERFADLGFSVRYLGLEPVGQLVDAQNTYFEQMGFAAQCRQLSLFDLDVNVDAVKRIKGVKIAFFFKVVDSLEMLKKDYAKEVLRGIVPLVNRCIISWATKSLGSKKQFRSDKKWLLDFLKKEFRIVDEFVFGSEKYVIISQK